MLYFFQSPDEPDDLILVSDSSKEAAVERAGFVEGKDCCWAVDDDSIRRIIGKDEAKLVLTPDK